MRRDLACKLRGTAVAAGYIGTSMVKNMNQNALDKILKDLAIGRLIEPEEIDTLVGDIFQNEALAGEVFHLHGELRQGSRR